MSKILTKKNYFPFLISNVLSAFNDNIYKSTLVLIALVISSTEKQSGQLSAIASGILILPFFIFSALGGALADRYPKTLIIRKLKFLEILIVIVGILALYSKVMWFMILVLFLLGVQSSLLGPVKFSYIPETQKPEDLLKATGLMEMGTFFAILGGMFFGNILITEDQIRQGQFLYPSIALVIVAILGYLMALKIPMSAPGSPSVKIPINPFPEYSKLYRIAKKDRSILYSILGISWFWFFGASIVTVVPNLVRFSMNGDKDVITLCLMLFTLSLAVGSSLCEKLSHTHIEIGLVPFAAIGISLFCLDISFIPFEDLAKTSWGIKSFLMDGNFHTWRFLFDIFGIGVFGAWFIVPLYALIEHRGSHDECSRLIAANNIINAFFIVISSIVFAALFYFEVKSGTQVLILSVLNIIVSFYVFFLVPEFLLRFLVWLIAKTTYSLRYTGRENIPEKGPALILANHVSYIDWLVLTAACQRPVRFVLHYSFYNFFLIKPVLKLMGCIPIAQEKESPKIKEQAFIKMEQALADGDIVCIFPEGNLTNDGALREFRTGYLKLLEKHKVPVIPVALSGLWGSYFSRFGGKALHKVPKPSRRKLKVAMLEPLTSEKATPELVQSLIEAKVEELNQKSW